MERAIAGELTQGRLRHLLNYDPESGSFTWKVYRSANANVGMAAGSPNGKGYLCIMVDRKLYLAHRLAWMYQYGEFPEHELDHADGCRANNRIANLRPATRFENQQNRKSVPNATGFVGASEKRAGRFNAQIQVSGAKIYLGTYDTPEEASAAYLSAKKTLHHFQPVARWMDDPDAPIPFAVTEAGKAALK